MPFVTNLSVADGGNGNASNADDFIRNKMATFITSATHFPVAADRWNRGQADVGGGSEFDVWLTPPTGFTQDVDEPPFMNFHTKADGIFQFPGNAFSGTEPSYDQPGGPGAFPLLDTMTQAPDWKSDADAGGLNPAQMCPYILQISSAPWSQHHLFAPTDGRYCHAAMETETRVWRHMWFGNFIKFGGDAAWNGGEYVTGMRWNRNVGDIDRPYDNAHMGPFDSQNRVAFGAIMNSIFRADGLEGALEWWTAWEISTSPQASGQTTPRPSGMNYSNVNQTAGNKTLGGGFANGRGRPVGATFFSMGPSLISNAKPLIPIFIGIFRIIAGGLRFSVLGQIPDVFRISMKGFTPGQEIVIGSDTYTVAPMVNSDVINTVADDQYSGYEGFAYRQIP